MTYLKFLCFTQELKNRVLAITSMANNFELALKNSYNQINKIKFDGMNYRKDIGFDLL